MGVREGDSEEREKGCSGGEGRKEEDGSQGERAVERKGTSTTLKIIRKRKEGEARVLPYPFILFLALGLSLWHF